MTQSEARQAAIRRIRPFRASVAAVAALVAVALVGCGASSGTHTVAANTLTKARFVAAANAICAKGDPALSAATFRLATLRGAAKVSAVRSTYVPMIEVQIEQIRSLGAPVGGSTQVASMLSIVQADLRRLDRDPALAATDVFGDFARVAHAFGLTACAPLS